MTKVDMLRAISERYGLEKNIDFARFFGITPQTANQQRQQGIIKYEDIYRRCPDISPDWLLSGGEGPMLRSERVENGGNLNYGNHVRQSQAVDSETARRALEALREEQEALKRSQEQVSGLIAVLHEVSGRG